MEDSTHLNNQVATMTENQYAKLHATYLSEPSNLLKLSTLSEPSTFWTPSTPAYSLPNATDEDSTYVNKEECFYSLPNATDEDSTYVNKEECFFNMPLEGFSLDSDADPTSEISYPGQPTLNLDRRPMLISPGMYISGQRAAYNVLVPRGGVDTSTRGGVDTSTRGGSIKARDSDVYTDPDGGGLYTDPGEGVYMNTQREVVYMNTQGAGTNTFDAPSFLRPRSSSCVAVQPGTVTYHLFYSHCLLILHH